MPKRNRKATAKRQAKPKKAKKRSPKRKPQMSGPPVSYAKPVKNTSPKILGKDGQVTIRHRELIDGDVKGTADWAVYDTLTLNPGLAATFPWLSSQAINWEMYRFNSLRFIYKPRCPTSTSGSLGLIPEYNVLDPDPTSEGDSLNYEGSKEGPVWQELNISLRTTSMGSGRTRHFIRSGAVTGSTLVDYDIGKLIISTNDGVDATKWGKVYVEYDVTLFTPQAVPPPTLNTFSQDVPMMYTETDPITVSSGTLVYMFPALGTNTNAIDLSVSNGTRYRDLTFHNEGNYMFTWAIYSGTRTPSLNPGWTPTVTGGTFDVGSFRYLETPDWSMGWVPFYVIDGKAGVNRLDCTVSFSGMFSLGTGFNPVTMFYTLSYAGTSLVYPSIKSKLPRLIETKTPALPPEEGRPQESWDEIEEDESPSPAPSKKRVPKTLKPPTKSIK